MKLKNKISFGHKKNGKKAVFDSYYSIYLKNLMWWTSFGGFGFSNLEFIKKYWPCLSQIFLVDYVITKLYNKYEIPGIDLRGCFADVGDDSVE